MRRRRGIIMIDFFLVMERLLFSKNVLVPPLDERVTGITRDCFVP
jgi:hypothetical protein